VAFSGRGLLANFRSSSRRMTEMEQWSWSKFFSGFVDGRNTAKSVVLTFHQILLILLITLSVFGVAYLKNKFFPRQTPQVQTIQTDGGSVDNSTTKQQNTWQLLGIHFGGTDNK